MDLLYRENDYFNENDHYVFFYIPNKKYFISKVSLFNGYFRTNESLRYKCTSLLCCNFNEYMGVYVKYGSYLGMIVNCSPEYNCVGIIYAQGQKKVPHYWVNINDLKY